MRSIRAAVIAAKRPSFISKQASSSSNSQFDQAMQKYEEAAQLDPTNKDYAAAAEVAKSHEVTALVQAAAKDRLLGDATTARAALSRALALDPTNFEVSQHLDELADEAVRSEPKSLYQESPHAFGDLDALLAAPGLHTFHTRTDARQIIQQVFQAYGISAMIDDSVRAIQVRIDLDDATFAQAARILGMVTHTFYVPLDAHHVVVATDTRENRVKYQRQDEETLYLSGLSDDEMKDVENRGQEHLPDYAGDDPAWSAAPSRCAPLHPRSTRSTAPCKACSTEAARYCWTCGSSRWRTPAIATQARSFRKASQPSMSLPKSSRY